MIEDLSTELYNFLKNETNIFDMMLQTQHGFYNIIHNVDQLNPYHEEGSVYVHTMMVVEYLISEFEGIRIETLVAAYLHDVGKIYTRTVDKETNRVRFFGHHGRSLFEVIDILKRIKSEVFGFQTLNIEMVLYMINFHMVDKYDMPAIKTLAKMFSNSKDLFDCSLGIFIDQLVNLLEADNFGRISRNVVTNMKLKQNKMWFESLKYDILQEITDIITEKEVEIYHSDVAIKDKKEKEKPFCLMLIGVPCSGKSTYVQHYKEGYDSIASEKIEIVSRDNIIMSMVDENTTYEEAFDSVDQSKVNDLLDKQIKQLIKNKKDFIIDMTNFSTKARRRRLSLLSKDYRKEAKVFIADSKTIFERNENREGKTIKKEVIESMMNGFMLPTFNEFDSIELFVQ